MTVHISAKYQPLTPKNLGGHVTLATPPFGQIFGGRVQINLSLETIVPNLESVALTVFELLAFNAEKFRGSRDPGYTPFWKNFGGSCSDCPWEHFCQISSP